MQISSEGKIGIGLTLAFGLGGGATVTFPEQRWIGAIIVLVSTIGLILLAISYFSHGKARMGPLTLMIVGGAAFCGGVIWHFWPAPAAPTDLSKPTAPFSWTWEPLTPDETAKLYAALEKENKQSIQIACINDACSDLANSLTSVFNKLDWPLINAYPISRAYVTGATGISVNDYNKPGITLKEALENSTKLAVTFRLPTDKPLGRPRTEHLILVIGGKQPPSPPSPETQKDILDLSARLRQLSVDISSFMVDRQREQTRLAPFQASQQSDPNWMRQNFERSRDFSNETSTLLQDKFGPRITRALADLDVLSIGMTFMVASSGSSMPQVWAKWFGVMADMIADGKIVEARANSADEEFWFKQMTP
jgi:hypothetical protein